MERNIQCLNSDNSDAEHRKLFRMSLSYSSYLFLLFCYIVDQVLAENPTNNHHGIKLMYKKI